MLFRSDETTFEQIHVSESQIGEKKLYLKENMIVTAKLYDGRVLSIDPPIHVVLKVIETDPGFKGDTVSGDRKSTRLNSSHIPLPRMPSSA